MLDVAKIDINSETTKLKQKKQYISIKMTIEEQNATGTDTVLKTKLFGLKVRHFNNSCLLIAFTRSIQALF